MTDSPETLSSQETSQYLKAISEPRDRAIALLFLTTGVLLNEIVELTVDHIDWDKRLLKIPGKRQRDLALNDQVFDALAKWSQERVTTSKSNAFFLTTKGKVNGLTSRGVDTLLRKYGKVAGLKKTVNAHLLRNTFGVRLFSEHPDMDLKKAGQLLGIRDADSLRRYQASASSASGEMADTKSDAASDTRPLLTRKLSTWFPTKPKTIKAAPNTPKINAEDLLFGRDHVIAETKACLNKGQSVRLMGDLGIGKTHLLKHICESYGDHAIYVSAPTPLKTLILDIVEKTSSSPDKPTKRSSVQDAVDYVIAHKTLSPPILFIDNLTKLRASDLELFLKLMDHFTILGAMDDTPDKLKTMWWKLNEVKLYPLAPEASKPLIKQLTSHMSISDYDQMENRILNLANGNPLAIVEMTKQLSFKPVVTRDAVRDIYHEAGVKYRDWSWGFAVIWGVIVISRFVALGTHSFEGYILAGVGTSIFVVIRTLMARMR